MGKKVNQLASTKTYKNEKQLYSLIKVLKPKVYITDGSSFKHLVQELTSNQSQTTAKPEEIAATTATAAATTSLSMDSSLICSFESCEEQAFQLEEIYQVSCLLMQAAVADDDDDNDDDDDDDDDISMFDHVSLLTSCQRQQTDWLAYQNLQSWLLDG